MGGVIEINRRQQKSLSFIRADAHSLQQGVIVAYLLKDTPFQVTSNRHGISIRGSYPQVGKAGITALMNILARAIRHHEHLKSFPLGTPQVALEESTFDTPPVAAPVAPSQT